MFNKKFLLLCLVFVVCSFLVVGCGLPKKPAGITVDDLDMVNAYVVGDNFAAVYNYPDSAEGYFGPYGTACSITTEAGALAFDCKVGGGWCTMDWKQLDMAADAYKYAVISMKVDSAANADDALVTQMTFGDKGCSLADWGISGLTTTYQTFIIDLPAKGFTTWKAPYFALNQDAAKPVVIYIDYLKLANKK